MSIQSRSHQYGTVFENWQILELLGQGSGGKTAVFRLKRIDSNRGQSALKVINLMEERGDYDSMPAHLRKEYEAARDDCKGSALQEVWLMDDFQGNTNIVDYLDHKFVDWTDDEGFGCDMLIRMELLKDLRSEIRSGKAYSEEDVIKIGCDICQALILCHGNDILHRDIKPENIFINRNGNYKLGDFGISRIISNAPMSMASTGIGTPEYAAPEQTSGRYDKRVDIYSLGLVLYELSNQNHLPFARSSYIRPDDVNMRLAGIPLPHPVNSSPELTKVILKACAFKPEERYQTVDDFLIALRGLQKDILADTNVSDIDEIESTGELDKADAHSADSPLVLVQSTSAALEFEQVSLRKIQKVTLFNSGKVFVEFSKFGEIDPKYFDLILHIRNDSDTALEFPLRIWINGKEYINTYTNVFVRGSDEELTFIEVGAGISTDFVYRIWVDDYTCDVKTIQFHLEALYDDANGDVASMLVTDEIKLSFPSSLSESDEHNGPVLISTDKNGLQSTISEKSAPSQYDTVPANPIIPESSIASYETVPAGASLSDVVNPSYATIPAVEDTRRRVSSKYPQKAPPKNILDIAEKKYTKQESVPRKTVNALPQYRYFGNNRAKKCFPGRVPPIIQIPDKTDIILSDAFRRVTVGITTDVEEVIVPEGVFEIQANAFHFIRINKSIALPDTLTEIGENAFVLADGAYVKCGEGTVAYRYCKQHGLKNSVEMDMWKKYGRCQHCGGSLSILLRKCKDCGRRKDY